MNKFLDNLVNSYKQDIDEYGELEWRDKEFSVFEKRLAKLFSLESDRKLQELPAQLISYLTEQKLENLNKIAEIYRQLQALNESQKYEELLWFIFAHSIAIPYYFNDACKAKTVFVIENLLNKEFNPEVKEQLQAIKTALILNKNVNLAIEKEIADTYNGLTSLMSEGKTQKLARSICENSTFIRNFFISSCRAYVVYMIENIIKNAGIPKEDKKELREVKTFLICDREVKEEVEASIQRAKDARFYLKGKTSDIKERFKSGHLTENDLYRLNQDELRRLHARVACKSFPELGVNGVIKTSSSSILDDLSSGSDSFESGSFEMVVFSDSPAPPSPGDGLPVAPSSPSPKSQGERSLSRVFSGSIGYFPPPSPGYRKNQKDLFSDEKSLQVRVPGIRVPG